MNVLLGYLQTLIASECPL